MLRSSTNLSGSESVPQCMDKVLRTYYDAPSLPMLLKFPREREYQESIVFVGAHYKHVRI